MRPPRQRLLACKVSGDVFIRISRPPRGLRVLLRFSALQNIDIHVLGGAGCNAYAGEGYRLAGSGGAPVIAIMSVVAPRPTLLLDLELGSPEGNSPSSWPRFSQRGVPPNDGLRRFLCSLRSLVLLRDTVECGTLLVQVRAFRNYRSTLDDLGS